MYKIKQEIHPVRKPCVRTPAPCDEQPCTGMAALASVRHAGLAATCRCALELCKLCHALRCDNPSEHFIPVDAHVGQHVWCREAHPRLDPRHHAAPASDACALLLVCLPVCRLALLAAVRHHLALRAALERRAVAHGPTLVAPVVEPPQHLGHVLLHRLVRALRCGAWHGPDGAQPLGELRLAHRDKRCVQAGTPMPTPFCSSIFKHVDGCVPAAHCWLQLLHHHHLAPQLATDLHRHDDAQPVRLLDDVPGRMRLLAPEHGHVLGQHALAAREQHL
mmetsp:Transcript_29857/g.76005  ORF Transcript_29857/g.76005 Transcript_29857/m.76005 type:complete len:277 (-) Transcript_29857:432-1262(-)